MPERHPGSDVEIVDGVPTSDFRCAIPNVKRYMKQNRWVLEDVAEAAFEGDYDKLEMLLATGAEMNVFNGDLNMHLNSTTVLHLASSSGHADCLELLLRAKADPHIRERMPHGKDPEDGRTALEYACEAGWDDCTEILEQAEKDVPYGFYVPAGQGNNAKCYNCWEWGKKPERGWYMSRPGAARKHGLDPNKFGAEDYEEPDILDLGSLATPTLQSPAVKPLPIGLLFPGHGSQYPQMMKGLQDLPAVKDILSKAEAILGYDVLALCMESSLEELNRIEKAHVVMFVGSMAGLEKLRQEREEAVVRCQAVAGLSLGELAALCAAGVFGFEDGLRLAKRRGEVLQVAQEATDQLSMTVAGLEKAKLLELCEEARSTEGGAAVCSIAQELFPKGFSCAGTPRAVNALKEAAEKAGALQVKVQGEHAVHTSLMAAAAAEFGEALDNALPSMKPPRCAVYMNVTGSQIRAGTAPQDIVNLLKKQLTSPVIWDSSVRAIIKEGVTEFYEVGPMKQLKAMMKRIDAKVWNTTYNVEV
mmetsp:Transcript_91248/g.261160  ORF Transcript_91248/g.261160 Transcript_91248/m.261160 type:complete len:531 (-) Transcript_91248:62-1654(-)